MNSWWEKYGCDTCSRYQLLVIDLNVKPADTKDGFIEYCTVNNVEYPAVWSGDGGIELRDAMGLGVSANSKYLIKPDRTMVGGVYDNTLTKAGIVEHTCDPVYSKSVLDNKENMGGVVRTGNAIRFNNVNGEFENLKLFDLQGRLLWHMNISNKNNLANIPNNLCAGIKVVSLTGHVKTVNQQIVFEN